MTRQREQVQISGPPPQRLFSPTSHEVTDRDPRQGYQDSLAGGEYSFSNTVFGVIIIICD
jgi:hypothetical protein